MVKEIDIFGDGLQGREDKERILRGKYKPWKELDLDSNGDLFIILGDNRDMITQMVDFVLANQGLCSKTKS